MSKLRFALLVAAVLGIGALHLFTPGYLLLYHDIYRRLTYFPIVLGAIWFGVRGGAALALLASVAFIPHLMLYLGKGLDLYISELMEVGLYLAAGIVTGLIAGREAKMREKYRVTAEKLERSYEKLHRETALLIEAEEQLSASQRLSSLGKLAASLAHEIKNPLGSIRGTAEIFLDEFPPGHPKREFVAILLKETERLNTTVEEILTYSKGEAGAGREETAPLSAVLDQVTKLLETHLRKKEITLNADPGEAASSFPVPSAKMAQVFLNVVLNAIDALPREGRIDISGRIEPDGSLRVEIADNGPGVAPDRLETIFDSFVSDKEEGTGLGLSISRKIVESCGGGIHCENAEGGGACFVLRLPPPAPIPAAGIAGPDQARQSSRQQQSI